MGMILIVIVLLVLISTLPTWPHSRGWGCYPQRSTRLVLLILIILMLNRTNLK